LLTVERLDLGLVGVMASTERQQKQKIFGPRVFCFGWYDHGRCGYDPQGGSSPAPRNGGGGASAASPAKTAKGALVLRKGKTSKAFMGSAKSKVPKYSNVPVPVNTLTGKETLGTVCNVAAGEHHTITITTRGQVFAFGNNHNGALGSNRLFVGRTTAARSRSTSRAQTPSEGAQRDGEVVVPPLLTNEAAVAVSAAAVKSALVVADDEEDPDPQLTASLLTRAQHREDDALPPVGATSTPVIVDMERAGCKIPVHIYAGAYSSYVLDGNGKIYSWGENNHGQLGTGDVDLFGKTDAEITEELDKLRNGPKVKKAKRWRAPGTVDKDQEKEEEGEGKHASADGGAGKRKSSGLHAVPGSTSGLRRGGGYNSKDGGKARAQFKKAGHVALAVARGAGGKKGKGVDEEEEEEEEEEDPFRYGTTVTEDLRFIGAQRPKKRRPPMPRPCLITPLAHKRVKMVAAGHRHVVALMLGGGLLYSWGFNRYGQLGLGGKEVSDVDLKDRSIPTILPTMRKVRCNYVSCGRHFTVALGDTADDRFLGMKEGGRLRRAKSTRRCMFVWGQNDSGQFATARPKDPNTPHSHPSCVKAEPVYNPATPDKHISKVFAGGNHMMLLTEGEVLAGVGSNMYGQLGLGDLYDRCFPMYLDSLGGVKMVAVGARHSMAVTQNNILWVWGFNCVGEMGTGNQSLFLLPEPVRAMRELRATDISAGYWHSAVVATDMPDESVPMWREVRTVNGCCVGCFYLLGV
jgi:alpha-tubulin suppressor-like RCC1 family protein